MTINYAAFSAVIQALFALQAFDPVRRRATKQIADEGNLSQSTAREALKHLERVGLVSK